MSAWTLKAASGAELALDAQQVTSAVLTEASQQSCQLVLQTVQALEDAGFSYRDDVRLYRDGIMVFRGVLEEPEFTGSAASEGRRYTVAGPGWWLEHFPVVGQWVTKQGSYFVPKGFLFMGGSGGSGRVFSSSGNPTAADPSGYTAGAKLTGLNIEAQMSLLIDQVTINNGPVAYGRLSLGFVTPPVQQWEMNTCAQLLAACLAFVPDAVQWWDYSSPELSRYNAVRAGYLGAEDTLTLQLGGDSPVVTEIQLAEARAQRVSQVVAYLHRQVAGTTALEAGYFTEFDVANWRLSSAPGEPADSFSSLQLIVESIDGTVTKETLNNVTLQYLEACQVTGWRGRFVYKGRDGEPHATLRPGKLVNLAGGRAEWSTMKAVVQSVTTNILDGTSTVVVGPPRVLGPQQFFQLQRNWHKAMRRTAGIPEIKEQSTGESDHMNYGMGKDNTRHDPAGRRCCGSGHSPP